MGRLKSNSLFPNSCVRVPGEDAGHKKPTLRRGCQREFLWFRGSTRNARYLAGGLAFPGASVSLPRISLKPALLQNLCEPFKVELKIFVEGIEGLLRMVDL